MDIFAPMVHRVYVNIIAPESRYGGASVVGGEREPEVYQVALVDRTVYPYFAGMRIYLEIDEIISLRSVS